MATNKINPNITKFTTTNIEPLQVATKIANKTDIVQDV